MHYRDPSSRSERGASRKHPPTGPPRRYASLPVIRLRYSASLWPQDKRPCRKDQRTTGRPANGEKASAPGAPGTRTPNLTTPTGPTPPVRQPYSRPPALQRKHLTTRLAFPLERQADGRKTSGPQEDQRITGGPVRQECGNATYPATLTVGTADPGKGTHLLIILSVYRLIDRRCSSPPELVLAYRGRPPIGRP